MRGWRRSAPSIAPSPGSKHSQPLPSLPRPIKAWPKWRNVSKRHYASRKRLPRRLRSDEPDDAEIAPPPPPAPPRAARPVEPKPARPDAKAREGAKEGKALYDTLEQEMASLLGRPTGKT